jgi:ubiquinone/menaquinone biosynthesis C-methylase UbiE
MLTSLAHSIVSHPWVYDRFQIIAGARQVWGRLSPHLQQTKGDVVLDVGGGTGGTFALLPSLAGYVWLDNDPMKLKGFRRKQPSLNGLLGDATCIPLKDKSVDDVLCVAVLHHLSDEQVALFLREAARVARKRFVLMDPVERAGSLISRLLWKYDRGSYPRTVEALGSAMNMQFRIEHTERFAVYHEYLICIGSPLPG